MPGVAKTIQFFGFGDYLRYSPIVPLRQLSPHRVGAEFGQTPFRGVKPDILPIQSYAFALPERFYITILVLGASNPAGITANFCFQFHVRINVVHEKSPLACFGVVLGHLIVVYLMNLEYPISFLHRQPIFIHYPGTSESAILSLGMHTFRTGGRECMFYTGRTCVYYYICREGQVGIICLAERSNI